jgi:hypothetical protein
MSADKFSREVFVGYQTVPMRSSKKRTDTRRIALFGFLVGPLKRLIPRRSTLCLQKCRISSRSSKAIDTLPFDVLPAEMQVTTNKVKHCKVLYRGKSLHAPCRVEATSLSEYVAQQPKHVRRILSDVRRILSDCDITETATQKLVSLLRSPGPVYGGTDGGLLNGLGTFGFVWGNISEANALYPIGKGHVPGAPLIMSSTRTEIAGLFAAITHLHLVVEYYAITLTKSTSCFIHHDSKGALPRVGDTRHDSFGTTRRCRPHYHLEVAIPFCSCQSPFRGIG